MPAKQLPIPDVSVHKLATQIDARGFLTEFFRNSWVGVPIRQWTAMSLGARVIRGPSVHLVHTDAVIALTGVLHIGLRDLRQTSSTYRQLCRLTLRGLEPQLVLIPPGVMHTFYAATEPAMVIVGSTHEYDPDDDIKCRWQDAGLDIDESIVGTIDSRARSLEHVIAAVNNRS